MTLELGKEGIVLFNDTLNTFYLCLYGKRPFKIERYTNCIVYTVEDNNYFAKFF